MWLHTVGYIEPVYKQVLNQLFNSTMYRQRHNMRQGKIGANLTDMSFSLKQIFKDEDKVICTLINLTEYEYFLEYFRTCT